MDNRSDESDGEQSRKQLSGRKFSPRTFLKGRHPDRYSDTVRADEPSLDRSLLEYHLHSLTTRGQEKDFETFARKLAQKEICPNLLPQTGPTGGGDSKVDSETYPVSDDLAAVWYVGVGSRAYGERWAFAFSAKQDWRPKVRSDVEKIKDTNRGYAKAFFVTNQPVPDRVRAAVEDELTNLHGLDVRILDRTWILDRVFENGHEALAVETLGLQTSIRTVTRKGPLDLQREQDLEDVERRISSAAEEGRLDRGFVDDCLEAAELARDLELSRLEVDGRFARAGRAAEEHGSPHQRLLCAYSEAWTSYWWHEDRRAFLRHYVELERLAGGTGNAYELELLHNAWNVLHTLVTRNEIDDSEVGLQMKTEFLSKELERLSGEEGRPSTALQARSMRHLMRLTTSIRTDGDLGPTFEGLEQVIRESRKLVGFPLDPLLEVLTEL